MSSPNYINNALTQLFEEIEEKCHVHFNTFTAHDKPEKKGINSDQVYMKQYLESQEEDEDKTVYKYLYDPDLNFDFRFHQRMSRINYKNREKPWVSLMFNTGEVHPLTDVLSHVYHGIEYAQFEQVNKQGIKEIVTEGVEYKFRRLRCPINFVLISNELSYLYQTTEKIAMYFDRWINYDYDLTLTFSPLTEKKYHLVGAAQNIREVHLDKLDTESKGSLCMSAFSFELIYWDVFSIDERYGLLQKIILEVREATSGQLLFLHITE